MGNDQEVEKTLHRVNCQKQEGEHQPSASSWDPQNREGWKISPNPSTTPPGATSPWFFSAPRGTGTSPPPRCTALRRTNFPRYPTRPSPVRAQPRGLTLRQQRAPEALTPREPQPSAELRLPLGPGSTEAALTVRGTAAPMAATDTHSARAAGALPAAPLLTQAHTRRLPPACGLSTSPALRRCACARVAAARHAGKCSPPGGRTAGHAGKCSPPASNG